MEETIQNLRSTTQLTPADIRSGVVRGDAMILGEVQVRANTAVERVEEDTGVTIREVDIVWTTGAPVTRYSWADDAFYTEELDLSASSIRLGRMNSGVPLLDSHRSWGGTDSVLGVVSVPKQDGDKWVATARFASTPDVDNIWTKVRTGILKNFSVGYRVWKYEVTKRDDGAVIKRATDWEPLEVSLVAIPADVGCTVREEDRAAPAQRTENTVEEDEVITPAPAPAAEPTDAQRSATVVAVERRRAADINAYVRSQANGANPVGAELIARALGDEQNAGLTLEALVREHVDAIAEQDTDTNIAQVRGGRSLAPSPEQELQLRGQALTTLAMSYIGRPTGEVSDQVRAYANEGLRGAGLSILRMHNVRGCENLETDAIFGRIFETRSMGGMATTDLAFLLATPFRASFDSGYQAQLRATSYERWTGERFLPDKKKNRALHVGFPDPKAMRRVAEGGTLPKAYFGEGGSFMELQTWGFEINITRDMRINDQFAAIPVALSRYGAGWRQFEQDACVAKLMEGDWETDAGLSSIWEEDFNDLEIAALDRDGLKAMKRALRNQRQDAKLGGMLLDTNAVTLIVSSDLEDAAETITTPGMVMATLLGEANPNSNTRLDYLVIDALPEGTAFLTSSTGLTEVLVRTRLLGEKGPQFQAAPQLSFNEVRYESWNDFEPNIIGKVGIVRAKVG